MKIATIGAGNVGGGLADLWESAGHEVQRLGKDGGDVSGVEVALLAVPSAAIADALEKAQGVAGKPVIDATNEFGGGRPEGFESLAEYVKSLTQGPVAKAFNTNYARLYAHLGEARSKPGCLFCGDDEVKEVTARLIGDAGYEPIDAGGLENARALEDFLHVSSAVSNTMGRFFYRMAPPDQL
jgi:8-hydroxy-5-deazaflavin:NADPH oxidoreductase